MCYSPISMKNPEGYIPVKCGKCYECIESKRREWTFRLQQELKVSTHPIFLTLTYDDDKIPPDGGLNYPDLQKFWKKLRKKMGKGLRYYSVGEYGKTTYRPHYHAIVFNIPLKWQLKLEEIWSHGFIKIAPVTEASIHYVTGYIMEKNISPLGLTPPKALMSKVPPLGENYVYTHTHDEEGKLVKTLKKEVANYHRDSKKFTVISESGKKIPLPKLYRERIFSQIERKVHGLEAMKLSTEQDLKLEIKARQSSIDLYQRIKERQDAKSRKLNQSRQKL